MTARRDPLSSSVLQRGLRLFSPLSRESFCSRFQVSSGTRPATLRDAGPPGYRDGAVVPEQPWLSPSTEDVDRFLELPGEWENCQSVCVTSLSPEARRELNKFGLATRPSTELDQDDQIQAFGSACLEILADDFDCSPNTYCHGVGLNQPGMLTTSIDRNINRLVGLHVDHWDGLPLTRRAAAGNRLAINVGTEPYYILLIPVTLREMARLIGREERDDVDLNTLPGQFLAANPMNPVYRIRIAPGDIYVVPTDNFIHDGSTEGGQIESRQLVFRGDIRPGLRLMADCRA